MKKKDILLALKEGINLADSLAKKGQPTDTLEKVVTQRNRLFHVIMAIAFAMDEGDPIGRCLVRGSQGISA